MLKGPLVNLVKLAAREFLVNQVMPWWASCKRVMCAMGRMLACCGTTLQGECCYSVMAKTGRCVSSMVHA